ncbi:division/cell wall cluster transcriptional repressor MraZ [Mycoplasma sp. CSL7475-4]|uniref:division/cell wall cluster transcriptional repressor MraZ n=1 Tax=Mycoplasma sp. CSL7475-4 TaxID=2973942 RepID=UPI00216AC012|nr:division/cell wall cluster transcriptional repressor MraZ [Mycoplasma sp. CSL7475-4]MCS4537145.1 division/cell wall cluster transcriptional repressor MraZ [Mycoplasma sp. CSL7475-4]
MYGQYERTIDVKNRVALPAKLRDALGSKFYLTIGMENVIEIRNEQQYEKLEQSLTSTSMFDRNAKIVKRWFLGHTYEIELDSQARFVIPKLALEKSAIQKEVVFIGTGDLVELWSLEQYQDYEASISDEKLQMAAESLMKGENNDKR